MDTPTKSDWDKFGTQKQRMFPRQENEETGLESLLAGWGIGQQIPRADQVNASAGLHPKNSGQVVIAVNPRTIVKLACSFLGLVRMILAMWMIVLSMDNSIALEQAPNLDPPNALTMIETALDVISLAVAYQAGGQALKTRGAMIVSLVVVRQALSALMIHMKDQVELLWWMMPACWMVWGILDFLSCAH